MSFSADIGSVTTVFWGKMSADMCSTEQLPYIRQRLICGDGVICLRHRQVAQGNVHLGTQQAVDVVNMSALLQGSQEPSHLHLVCSELRNLLGINS